MNRLQIRDTDVSVLDILEMLAESQTTAQISRRFPGISTADIAFAAATARSLILYHWAVCRTPELAFEPDSRVVFCDRPTKWTREKELELVGLFRSGAGVEEMARIFMTIKTEIIERLKRLNVS